VSHRDETYTYQLYVHNKLRHRQKIIKELFEENTLIELLAEMNYAYHMQKVLEGHEMYVINDELCQVLEEMVERGLR